MDYIKLSAILTASALFIAALAYSIINAKDWYKNRNPQSELENGIKEDARFKFFVSIGTLIILIAISVIFYIIENNNSSEETPDPPPKAFTNDTTKETEANSEVEIEQESTTDSVNILGRRYSKSTYYGTINEKTEEPNGFGRMEYDNQDVYEGYWVNGVREGKGYMKYHNGDTYDGDWKNDMRYGIGTYTWFDGGQYEGEYKNDMRDGEGIYMGWTGYLDAYGWTGTYRGASKEDMFEGNGVFEFDNGDIFRGYFSQNKIWTGEYTRLNGVIYSIVEGEKAD